jgi:hypothetical protein
MELTHNYEINTYINTLHDLIVSTIPNVVMKPLPGYRSNQYSLGTSMKYSVCYIICYDQKANFGFDRGVELQSEFPMLKGTGKFHRHLSISKALLEDHELLISIIKKAFSIT